MAGQQHTPGPWEAVKASSGETWAIFGPQPHDLVAQVCGLLGEQDPPNARLISAAPDLLAALVAVVAVADRQTTEFDAARAAIAKARGE